MIEHKCICCGQVKKSEFECSCSNCGYTMYPLPYVRRMLLNSKIKEFIKELILPKISSEAITFYRLVPNKNNKLNSCKKVNKIEDNARFPNYRKIQEFICSSNKTETFVERLNTSFEQFDKHFNTTFQMEYIGDYNNILEEIDSRERVLEKALDCLNVSFSTTKLIFCETKLCYTEIPDVELLQLVKILIESLKSLTQKIAKFIKQNNIYGSTYKKKYATKFKTKSNVNYYTIINEMIEHLNDIIEKKYQVDIFSDGEIELNEMLECLWKGIEIVLGSPIFVKKYQYEYDGKNYNREEFDKVLDETLKKHYVDIYNVVFSTTFLDDKTEEELFNLYNKMIDIDTLGLMGINKSLLSMPGKYEGELNNLIGLSKVKDSIKKIKAYAVNNKDSDNLNINMCFYGNPGTGKTEVARLIAGILHENGILPSKHVVEVDRGDLIGQYVGETPQKTMQKIQEAMGGVLFIDEAYALVQSDNKIDYGHEAIATLIKAMEDYRGKFCVILAGYKTQMFEMISTNPGFKSRIQFELEFPNYSRVELEAIIKLMLKNRKYKIDDLAIEKILDITDIKRREPNFANAREVRNILDGVIMCQNLRVVGTNDKELGIVDVNRYINDQQISLQMSFDSKRVLTAEEKLENLVGLDSIKKMIKKIKAYAKRNMYDSSLNLHMCFYGNPGTGKTEVARIISSILYENGILPEAKLVETDAHGLIGKFVGETAPKTETKIKEALGGVLFIDEAYGLMNTSQNYGNEAIEVLLKNMEDHRGKLCIIFAGYKKEMQNMINSNPGLKSRIQFNLEFPDYTRSELGEIAIKFLNERNYEIDSDALELLLNMTEYFRTSANFANSRTIRHLIEQVIMNQNLRTENIKNDNKIILLDVEEYVQDENIKL